jgi:hypothetical protein
LIEGSAEKLAEKEKEYLAIKNLFEYVFFFIAFYLFLIENSLQAMQSE